MDEKLDNNILEIEGENLLDSMVDMVDYNLEKDLEV